MSRIFIFLFFFITKIVLSQTTPIVSLDNSNIWIYEVSSYSSKHDFNNNSDSVFYNNYSIIYKVAKDTIINNNLSKVIEVTSFQNFIKDFTKVFYYSDSYRFDLSGYSYNSFYTSTLFDTKFVRDTSWGGHQMGGIDWGYIIKLFSSKIFNEDVESQSLESYSTYGSGLGGSTRYLTAKKFGVIENNTKSNTPGSGIRTYSESIQKLIGAKIDGNLFGRLEPPEIFNYIIKENDIEISYIIPGNRNISKVYMYNYDESSHNYKIIDSINTNSTKIAKTLPLGSYNIRIKYKDQNGIESALSNKITFEIIPTRFIVFPNYPNPFNNKTKIKFIMPEKSKVTLNVFNILGQIVYESIKEVNSPGIYEFDLELKNLSSGVYLYRVSNQNNQIVSNKMVLLK